MKISATTSCWNPMHSYLLSSQRDGGPTLQRILDFHSSGGAFAVHWIAVAIDWRNLWCSLATQGYLPFGLRTGPAPYWVCFKTQLIEAWPCWHPGGFYWKRPLWYSTLIDLICRQNLEWILETSQYLGHQILLTQHLSYFGMDFEGWSKQSVTD